MTVDPITSKKLIQEMHHRLAEHYSDRDALLFKTGINTLLRIGDLLRLRYTDIFFPGGEFRNYVQLKEQKRQKQRRIRINKPLRQEIRAYTDKYSIEGKDYLFMSFTEPTKAYSRKTARAILKRCSMELGIENFGTHSLRKTGAYFMYKGSGHNLVLVQEILGHNSPTVTLRYIGITQLDLDKAFEANVL